MGNILSLFLLTGSLQAAPLWLCDNGQSEIHWLSETEEIQVRLRDPEDLKSLRASTEEEACAENYYSPTHALICLKKELSASTHWQNGSLLIDKLKRWNFGDQLQFLAGQYQPSMEPIDDGWIVHLSNAKMANSKTLIQWDNGPIHLSDCQVQTSYPQARTHIQVLGDQYRQGQLTSKPLSHVTVYAGDWHAGQVLGKTDDEGKLSLDLEVGTAYISVLKQTSSHSALWSDPQAILVTQKRDNNVQVHVAPTTIRLISSTQLPYGKALYITGEGDYLGNWKLATRLNYLQDGHWELLKNLPVGAEFKLLAAEWTSSSRFWIQGHDVSWETGSNRKIPSLGDYYEVVIEADPSFL